MEPLVEAAVGGDPLDHHLDVECLLPRRRDAANGEASIVHDTDSHLGVGQGLGVERAVLHVEKGRLEIAHREAVEHGPRGEGRVRATRRVERLHQDRALLGRRAGAAGTGEAARRADTLVALVGGGEALGIGVVHSVVGAAAHRALAGAGGARGGAVGVAVAEVAIVADGEALAGHVPLVDAARAAGAAGAAAGRARRRRRCTAGAPAARRARRRASGPARAAGAAHAHRSGLVGAAGSDQQAEADCEEACVHEGESTRRQKSRTRN